MLRRTALVLVIALTTVSARQLACVWGCGEETATTHRAASCHETPATAPTIAASYLHCPFSPEAAVLTVVKSSDLQRQRVADPFARVVSTPLAAVVRPAGRYPWHSAPRSSPGSPSSLFSVLRI